MSKIIPKPIKGFGAFAKVYACGRKFREKNLTASVVFADDGTISDDANFLRGEQILRFGVSIGKRTAKRAVVRNRIKRLLRESLRAYCKTKERSIIYEAVLVWRMAPPRANLIRLIDVQTEVFSVLSKAEAYFCDNLQGIRE